MRASLAPFMKPFPMVLSWYCDNTWEFVHAGFVCIWVFHVCLCVCCPMFVYVCVCILMYTCAWMWGLPQLSFTGGHPPLFTDQGIFSGLCLSLQRRWLGSKPQSSICLCFPSAESVNTRYYALILYMGSGHWTQGPVLAKQALYRQNQPSPQLSLSFFVYEFNSFIAV